MIYHLRNWVPRIRSVGVRVVGVKDDVIVTDVFSGEFDAGLVGITGDEALTAEIFLRAGF